MYLTESLPCQPCNLELGLTEGNDASHVEPTTGGEKADFDLRCSHEFFYFQFFSGLPGFISFLLF